MSKKGMVITTGLLLLVGVYGVVSYNNFHFKETLQGPITLSAKPTVGSAPLSVRFSANDYSGQSFLIDYGDGQEEAMTQGSTASRGMEPPDYPASATHIYAAPGAYVATLKNSAGLVIATSSIIIESLVTATIDLYASMPSPHALTISGSADGTDAVHLGICPVRYCGRSGMTSGKVAVVEGRWSETFEAGMIEPGSYKVSLSKWADGTSLATSTITVQP